MTLPPLAWIVLIELPKVEEETDMLVLPFQSTVQDPAEAVCRKAMVRYFAPDWEERVARSSPVQASKYGANTCAGTGVAACAPLAPPMTTNPAAAAVVASAVMVRRVLPVRRRADARVAVKRMKSPAEATAEVPDCWPATGRRPNCSSTAGRAPVLPRRPGVAVAAPGA